MMYEQGKSDGRVVPKKLSNKAAEVAAETVEGRRPAKGNTHQQNASRTQSRTQGAVLAPDVIRARSCRDLVVMMEPTEDRPRDDPTRIRAGCPWCYGWYGNLLADPLVRSEGIEVL